MRSLVSKKQNISQVPTWYRSFTAKGQFAHDSRFGSPASICHISCEILGLDNQRS